MKNTKEILKHILSKRKYENNLINTQYKYENVIEYLSTLYNDSDSLIETIYRLINNIDQKPICPICGNRVNLTIKTHIFFPRCCCSKCSHKLSAQVSKEKCMALYGKDNYTKLDSTKQKYKETCMRKYGTDSYFQSDLFKTKSKNTCLERYGVEHNLQIPEIHQRGVEKSQSSESINKRNNTIFKKYGVDNVSKSPLIKKKKENTFLKHYGAKNNFGRSEIKSICNFGEARDKMYETKRKNHTFNSSKPETESYSILKEKYPNTVYQYKDKDRYPFVCDFYVPSLDLFIECNYHWTHDCHSFNQNNLDDQEKLKLWESKNMKFYNNSINTWTVRDIKKRKIAKQNNLNYIEFWNIQELKNWLNE